MKIINRFFIDDFSDKNQITLVGDEAHHLKNVLKLKENEKVICIKDRMEYISVIKKISKSEILLEIEAALGNKSENEFNVTLIQGMPKGDKVDFITEKAVECGAHSVIAVNTNRSVAKLKSENIKKKKERFEKISKSAACQCGRAYIPKIECYLDIKEIDFSKYDLCILCYEDENESTFKKVLFENKNKKNICVFIGPEGGISESEVSYLKSKGFISVSLGKRILRCETAGIYALSNINFALND